MSHAGFGAVPLIGKMQIAKKSSAHMILNAVRAPVLLLNGEDTIVGANEAALAAWAPLCGGIIRKNARELISAREAAAGGRGRKTRASCSNLLRRKGWLRCTLVFWLISPV